MIFGRQRSQSWCTIALYRRSNLSDAAKPVYDICRLQTADCRLQTADCRPQTADCRLQTADRRLQTADRRPQIADDRRLQTADCKLQTADRRPQIADCKLKATKKLPNKGDTIKNINRVKVRKRPGNRGWFFCAKLHWPHFQDAVGYSFYWLTRHITNCNDFLFFLDYYELIMTSSNSH